MKNQGNRDVMAKLYRILEAHEEPAPEAFVWQEDAQEYFTSLLRDLETLWTEYKGSALASQVGWAIYNALEETFQRKMTGELKSREAQK